MARIADSKKFLDTKTKLLEAGVALMRTESYSAVGIQQILQQAKTPKGSFYHYFQSKEAFGLAVAEFYHEAELQAARLYLTDYTKEPMTCLKSYFAYACEQLQRKGFKEGCLMCNLSVELADSNDAFQALLSTHWNNITSVITSCLERMDLKEISMAHLSCDEAADWLFNSWAGALARMKAQRSIEPLHLFLKSIFKDSDLTSVSVQLLN